MKPLEFFLLQKSREVLHGIFLKPQHKMYRGTSFLYLNAPFFDVTSFSKISQPPGQNQQNGKQCCLPPFSFKISLKDTYSHISLNSLELYFSPEYLLNFLVYSYSFINLFIPLCLGDIFKFVVFAFLENALNLGIFAHAPVPHSKLHARL